MCEKAAHVWDIQGAEPHRVYQIKGLPDCSAAMTTNSILLHSFEQAGSNVGVFQDLSMPSKQVRVMYCMAGHKISAGHIPVPSASATEHINFSSTSPKEVI